MTNTMHISFDMAVVAATDDDDDNITASAASASLCHSVDKKPDTHTSAHIPMGPQKARRLVYFYRWWA